MMTEDYGSIEPILRNWHLKQPLTATETQKAIELELADAARSQAWSIDRTNIEEKIDRRWQLFALVCPEVIEFCEGLSPPSKGGACTPRQNRGFESTRIFNELWRLWLPLAIQLAETRSQLGRTLIQGILGGQGTGKSTLSAIVRIILHHLGYEAIDLSLDDLYLTYAERQQLLQRDPRLIWRGPPGTHDVNLGLKVLDLCLQNNSQEPILIPRFDKSLFKGSGDRSTSESINRVDVVLFEGWFVGVRPIADSNFDRPPSPIITAEDRAWARDNNDRLQSYLPLWEKLDRLIVLKPVDYRLSKQWRKEAEHKAIAQGKEGMSDRQIDAFVEYFWKSLHPELFIPPLINNPHLTDLVIEINAAHQTSAVRSI
jgi:D-glycerate 3-kinase